MNTQQKLNEALSANYEAFERTLPRKNGQVMRAAGGSRLTIADVLAKYADSTGKIPKNKTTAVVAELSAIQDEIYRDLNAELRTTISDSAEDATVSTASLIATVIGVLAVIKFAGLSKAIADFGADIVAQILFSALTGFGFAEFIKAITDSVFNHKADDGKQLNDRLHEVAKALHDGITETIRKSIRNGEGVTGIIRKVKQKFREVNNRLKTIVETESLYAHRQALAWFAEKSGLVSALKIVDYPHGDPAEHRRHKCYIYAHQDEYGLGEGVYPVSTRKIRHPHPRCRSTLHFILDEKLT